MLSRSIAPANAARQGLAASARVASRRCVAARPAPITSGRAYSSQSGRTSSSRIGDDVRRRPAVIAATAVATFTLAYAASNSRTIHLESEAAKRKAYHERMKDEHRTPRKSEGKAAKVEEEKASDAEGDAPPPAAEAMDELEEEASQESAFDPETNTINWDCPCLGGMAHGPCGEEFKTAFSCFVFSEAEPKGIDCVENFKNMQDCFRRHPEHYKEELEDFDEADREEAAAAASAADSGSADSTSADDSKPATSASSDKPASSSKPSNSSADDDDEGVKEWQAELAKEK